MTEPREVPCEGPECHATVVIRDGRSSRRCAACRREQALQMERRRYHIRVGHNVEDIDTRPDPEPPPAVDPPAIPMPCRPVVDGSGRVLGYSVWHGGTLDPFIGGRAEAGR